MAGHSKWANIKHRKGAQDQKRGKIFTKIIKEITIASRIAGGDLDSNPRLRKAVSNAKSNNVPAGNIERAIKKGIGNLDGVAFDEITYEGYGPNGVAIIIEVITDNKNRSVAELRHLFTKFGGSLGETGSVSWMFEKKGQIVLEDNSIVYENLFDTALISGAEDLVQLNDNYIITTPFESLMEINKKLENDGYIVKSADYEMKSKTLQKVTKSESDSVIKLLESLDNNDDVNRIFSNLDLE